MSLRNEIIFLCSIQPVLEISSKKVTLENLKICKWKELQALEQVLSGTFIGLLRGLLYSQGLYGVVFQVTNSPLDWIFHESILVDTQRRKRATNNS